MCPPCPAGECGDLRRAFRGVLPTVRGKRPLKLVWPSEPLFCLVRTVTSVPSLALGASHGERTCWLLAKDWPSAAISCGVGRWVILWGSEEKANIASLFGKC